MAAPAKGGSEHCSGGKLAALQLHALLSRTADQLAGVRQKSLRHRLSAIHGKAVGSQPPSERSRLRSAISVPHTSRHFHSSSPNEIPPTPDRSQASSPPPARANNRGHNRHSQLQSPHHRQLASSTAPGHSPRRTRHASRTNLQTEIELRKWTVFRLQRFLKEHGIHFHRNDNKARLFNLYKPTAAHRPHKIPLHIHPFIPPSHPPPGLSMLSQRSTTSNTSLTSLSITQRLRLQPSITRQGGRMACNNFNELGCFLSNCRLIHICSFRGGAHTRSTCPHNPT
ncbi:hypothetical protein NQZ68_008898 [Dissostichus eleginoides]|nr:hypothetical protein NQZ68_008898 [Dissostichus eleginoides]